MKVPLVDSVECGFILTEPAEMRLDFCCTFALMTLTFVVILCVTSAGQTVQRQRKTKSRVISRSH